MLASIDSQCTSHAYHGIAAATAVLDVIEHDQLLDSVSRTGQALIDGLGELAKRHSGIGGVRGCGLFTAVEFVDDEGGLHQTP